MISTGQIAARKVIGIIGKTDPWSLKVVWEMVTCGLEWQGSVNVCPARLGTPRERPFCHLERLASASPALRCVVYIDSVKLIYAFIFQLKLYFDCGQNKHLWTQFILRSRDDAWKLMLLSLLPLPLTQPAALCCCPDPTAALCCSSDWLLPPMPLPVFACSCWDVVLSQKPSCFSVKMLRWGWFVCLQQLTCVVQQKLQRLHDCNRGDEASSFAFAGMLCSILYIEAAAEVDKLVFGRTSFSVK